MKIVLSCAEVADRLNEFLILDMRTKEEFDEYHVNGAVFWPGNPHLKNGDAVINKDEFAALMSQIGATKDSKILAYDDGNRRNPARMWMVAAQYGHMSVYVLDGGWPAAKNSLPLSNTATDVNTTTYTAEETGGYIATSQDIVADFDKMKLLDVRTLDEFTGKALMGNSRGGRITGAVNVDFNELLNTEGDEFFLAPDKIESIMTAAGIAKDDHIVPY